MNTTQIFKQGLLFGLLSSVTFCAMMALAASTMGLYVAYQAGLGLTVLNIIFLTVWVYFRMRKKYKAKPPFFPLLAICWVMQAVSFLFYAYGPQLAFWALQLPGGPETVSMDRHPFRLFFSVLNLALITLGMFYLADFISWLIRKL